MDYTKLEGKKILITGATGLIGKNIIKMISELNKGLKKPVKIVAVVRNLEKAERLFGDCENIEYIVSDISMLKPINNGVNYIIHGASQTSSREFVDHPISTIMTAINGTKAVLEYARVNPVSSFVYLSSMEVYGAPQTDELIYEDSVTNLDTMNVRSSYPESKRMCENICTCYMKEYGIPIKVIRLTQTFGPGVDYSDNRVFAEFARCVIEKRDIILKTKGETKRSYLYIDDAVRAIITVLLYGKDGEAYNAANENTYCSIYNMAMLVADKCANGNINVRIEEDESSIYGYAPTLKMNLSTEKLRKLGWKAETDLQTMYLNLIGDMEKQNN